MVPSIVAQCRARDGFPRASGDGPTLSDLLAKRVEFPPRERGWSRMHQDRITRATVSPARAGMVPL